MVPLSSRRRHRRRWAWFSFQAWISHTAILEGARSHTPRPASDARRSKKVRTGSRTVVPLLFRSVRYSLGKLTLTLLPRSADFDVEKLVGNASPVYLLYMAIHEGPASSMMVGPKTGYLEFVNSICQKRSFVFSTSRMASFEHRAERDFCCLDGFSWATGPAS